MERRKKLFHGRLMILLQVFRVIVLIIMIIQKNFLPVKNYFVANQANIKARYGFK